MANTNPKQYGPNMEFPRWYGSLDVVSRKNLYAGDILLKKDYEGKSPVVKAQKPFKAERGSKYTCHAMLYIGKGMVAEASASAGKVHTCNLNKNYKDTKIIAYRPKTEDAAKKAVELATYWESLGTIKYSKKRCATAFTNRSSYGQQAKRRAVDVKKWRKQPEDAMMCSEFVAFCYQYHWIDADDGERPYILLDALHTSPIRLEDYLNGGFADGDGVEQFDFLGKLEPVDSVIVR